MKRLLAVALSAVLCLSAASTAQAAMNNQMGKMFSEHGFVGAELAYVVKNISTSAGVGYATGGAFGGAVTQLTSRTTGVTLNKLTGQITLFTAAGSATAATFTVSDTSVAATDTIVLNQASGTNLYELFVTAVAANSFNVTFFTTGGTASDAPVINFAVIKGSAN